MKKLNYKNPKNEKETFSEGFLYFCFVFLGDIFYRQPCQLEVKSELWLHQVRNAAAEGILTKINTFNEKAAHILNRSGNAEFSR
jgi:hypothetical protein